MLLLLVLFAGVVLAVIVQPRFGAGHPTVLDVVGAGTGAATVSPSSLSAVPAGQAGRFGISGSVTGLYPGSSLPLVLTVSNPQQFTIVVTSISASAGSPNAGCQASNLSVSQFAGSLSVPARGVSKVTVTASLSHAAPDACQGVTFPLQYTGTATKP